MKFSLMFLFCVLVTVITVVQCSNQNFREAMRECKEKTGATESIWSILKQNKLPEDSKSFCAMACAFKKMNELNADNTVNLEGLKKLLERTHVPSDKIQTVAQMCITKVGTQTDECQAGKLLMTCVQTNRP